MLYPHLRNLMEDRRGATAILIGVMAAVIIGATSLGAEVVDALMTQRKMQAAADSAAISAANAKQIGFPTDYTQEAYAIAAADGFTSGQGAGCSANPTVYVGPPCAGDAAAGFGVCSSGNCVEVLIERPFELRLANVVTAGNFTLHARAAAYVNTSTGACSLALGQTPNPTVKTNGTTSVNFQNCALAANSTNQSAVSAGGGGILTVTQLFTGGNPGYAENGGGVITASGTDCIPAGSNTNCMSKAPATLNPYASLPMTSCNGGLAIDKNTTSPVPPGCYSSLVLNGCNATHPGVVLAGGGVYSFSASGSGSNTISVSGNCSLTENAPLTIVLTSNSGQVGLTGGNVNLTAQSTGPYAGVLFFSNSTASQTFTGGTTMLLTGALVFPNAQLQYTGGTVAGAPSTQCTQLIANNLVFTGTSGLTAGCAAVSGKQITQPAVLLE